MKLATIRIGDHTAAARLDGDRFVEIAGQVDVGTLLQQPDWQQLASAADGPSHDAATAVLHAPIGNPSKVLCVGLNYKSHILEMGRDLPSYPTLFAKFADTLTGPTDDVEVPVADAHVDWEAELVIVIGKEARRVPETDSHLYIAGYTAANDISMREFQFRTKEWLQGKIWQQSTPVGPVVVTPEELSADAEITTHVDGTEMQRGSISDLVHDPAFLVSYISEIITLRPGDLILTGTTGGVGRARKPELYLTDGQVVTVAIDGVGELRTTMRAQRQAPPVPSTAVATDGA